MLKMHLTHTRTSDLNLLPALAVLLEERSISKAAARYNLSQPAMSRLLQRLRDTFNDELLIRTTSGYELTARARHLEVELRLLLPKVDRLLRGNGFDPTTATDVFRICATSTAATLVLSRLPRRLLAAAPNTVLDVVAWDNKAFDDIAHGKLDALLTFGRVPPPLLSQELLDDQITCVMCDAHPLGKRALTKEIYLAYPHVILPFDDVWQSAIATPLTNQLRVRRAGLYMPFYGAAVTAIEGTELIVTMPRRIAETFKMTAPLRIEPFPFSVDPIRYLIAWHPSSDQQPALVWFRAQVAKAFKEIAAQTASATAILS